MREGVHKITIEEYQRDPCPEPSLSRSVIKDILFKCPRKAFHNHPRLNPDCIEESDKKFDIGTAAHSLFLEGVDKAEVIDAKDWRTKAAQEAREAARLAGKVPLLPDQHDSVMEMVETAKKALQQWVDPWIHEWIEIQDGDSELTYIWKEKNGVWCRIRPDWINKERTIVLDYKTTGVNALPEDYISVATNTGLDIQEAFYKRGVATIEGKAPDFVFMIQETEAPYLCSFMRLDMMFQDMGDEKVRRGIELWHQCLSTGEWPGYSNQTYTLEPKPWALASWEMIKGSVGGHYDV